MTKSESTVNWLPLLGEWDLSDPTSARFIGGSYPESRSIDSNAGDTPPAPQRKSPLHGIALSNLPFVGGTMEATFTFNEVERPIGELILAYNPATQGMVTAGIGGGFGMFSVREWIPAKKEDGDADQSRSGAHWDTIEVCGLRSNIQAGTTYHVRAALRGSKVELAVNDILVISTRFRRSIPKPSSAGLFCGSFAQVTAADFRVHAERPRAFVVMQLSEESTHVYLDVIKAVCAEFGITAIRADEIYGPGVIVTDIVEQVIGAHLVIADISSPNANVYFEVGYALASDKPIVLLAKKGTSLPFDISGFRVLFYEDSIAGKAKVEVGLRQHLTALLGATAPPGPTTRLPA